MNIVGNDNKSDPEGNSDDSKKDEGEGMIFILIKLQEIIQISVRGTNWLVFGKLYKCIGMVILFT